MYVHWLWVWLWLYFVFYAFFIYALWCECVCFVYWLVGSNMDGPPKVNDLLWHNDFVGHIRCSAMIRCVTHGDFFVKINTTPTFDFRERPNDHSARVVYALQCLPSQWSLHWKSISNTAIIMYTWYVSFCLYANEFREYKIYPRTWNLHTKQTRSTQYAAA